MNNMGKSTGIVFYTIVFIVLIAASGLIMLTTILAGGSNAFLVWALYVLLAGALFSLVRIIMIAVRKKKVAPNTINPPTGPSGA